MARILITSGPTRQYLDPVRYISNASSGRMGSALATAALALGHEVVIISGPVNIQYPEQASIIDVVSTEDMLRESKRMFRQCDGAIGAAAPCDYMPRFIESQKIAKTGAPLKLELVETPDVVATLGQQKQPGQWVVGFALETENELENAKEKIRNKNLDLIVLNSLNDKGAGFGTSTNKITFVDKNSRAKTFEVKDKSEVAADIWKEIIDRIHA